MMISEKNRVLFVFKALLALFLHIFIQLCCAIGMAKSSPEPKVFLFYRDNNVGKKTELFSDPNINKIYDTVC